MQDFTHFNPSPNKNAGLTASISSEAIFFQRVYGWMFAALSLTAGLSYFLSMSNAWVTLMLSNQLAWWVVALAPLGLTWWASAKANTLSASATKGVLMAVAAFFAGTLSVLFVVYPSTAFVKAFVCTAGIYGSMAVFGLVTKRSLEAWGSFLMMGVVGLIIASLLNMFLKSGPMDYVICIVGVLVFAGLTAYDHQKLRVAYFNAEQNGMGQEDLGRQVAWGAMTLYLDFINLFLFLLRFFGRSND